MIAKAGAPSGSAISIGDVALPNRLIIDRVSFSPNVLRSRQRVVVRFRDGQPEPPGPGCARVRHRHSVRQHDHSTGTATGPDGYVTFVFRPTVQLKVGGRGSQSFMIRARKSGERLIGGVSTRRLSIRGR